MGPTANTLFSMLRCPVLLIFYLSAAVTFLPVPCPAAELHLLAGAGLRQPTDLIIKRFEKQSQHRVFVTYDGGGKLLTRILASGRGDLYMPGAFFYIERLRREGKIRSVRPVVAHTPVVGVSRGAGDRIRSVQDLADTGVRLALGDPETMAFGRIGRTILRRAGIEQEALQNVVVYGATVKQLSLYLARGDVDAAIIGRADAYQFRDRIQRIPIPRRYFEPERIAVAVLASSSHPKAAAALRDFLSSKEAIGIFRRFGFLPLRDEE